jgi:hypothetical protein
MAVDVLVALLGYGNVGGAVSANTRGERGRHRQDTGSGSSALVEIQT